MKHHAINILCLLLGCLLSTLTLHATETHPTVTSVQQPTEKTVTTSILTLFGSPKYPANFEHLAYVNAQAPKCGTIILSAKGSFDNFNRFASRGIAAVMSDELYDSLFFTPDDELGSYYPLIATHMTYTTDYRWAEVNLNPNARFHDQHPLTADDVEFTFHKLMTEGVPQYRSYYRGVEVKAITPHIVRFSFSQSDKELMFGLIAAFKVIPKHFWQNKDLSQPLSTPPLGSGPYKVGNYKLGQYVTYKRIEDYWAQNLPVNKGRNNFDTMRYDYYLDDNVALEAFKAGEYDIRSETLPKTWITQYQGTHFSNGNIIKITRPLKSSPNTQWLAFNTTRPLFNDLRIRQAITLAFDFDWQNRALYYSTMQRVRSYFTNTPYEAVGVPSEKELEWLLPFKDELPPEIFTTPYQPPTSDASGFNRANLLHAATLLNNAGWQLKEDGQLYHQQTGEPFIFELSLRTNSYVPYVYAFQQNLARLGIKMVINQSDATRLTNRLRHRDFDMIPINYYSFDYPSNGLKIMWGSEYVNSTWNATGFTRPIVDFLLDKISEHQDDPSSLLSLGRALDRILTGYQLMIPMGFLPEHYYAYWDKFGQPNTYPLYALGISSWWYDSNKPLNQRHNRK